MAYTCKILAIDGGGIRGIIPAYILQQLEASLNTPVYTCFDVMGGTSTGGIITMGLTSPIVANNNLPYSASDILNFYLNDESQIFVKQASGDGAEAKYFATDTNTKPPSGIEPWLQAQFTSTLTLAQAQQQMAALDKPIPKQVFTTCYTINGVSGVAYGPYLFNWVDALASSADDYCVWEAARATSAAPTYFPVANVGVGVPNGSQATNRWVVDGGVAANNPALFALAQAARLNLFTSLSEVLLISLGTGAYDVGIQITDQGNWGALSWLTGVDTNGNLTEPLINVFSNSNVLAPEAQLQYLMPAGNYYRFNPVIPYNESTLDGTDTQALLTTAQNYLAEGGAGYASFQAIVAALSS